MTGRRLLPYAVCTAFVTAAVPAGMPVAGVMAAPQDPPKPTFRSGASVVVVDASVRDRSRRVVTGLTARDFQVFDNGVPQQVDDVSYGRLPIDVTVALDVSYSVSGDLLNRLRLGVTELMRDLQPQDRLKLVLFNMRVSRTIDYTTDAKAVDRAMQDVAAGGATSLLDALSVTLVSKSDPDRRQLIVFFTDGTDSTSITSPEKLTAVAQRARATLTFVMPSTAPVPLTLLADSPDGVTAIRSTVFMKPGPLSGLFFTLAHETGGWILPVGSRSNLASAFRTVLGDFRTAYVLYYTPRGVDRAGYHTIEVKVNREGAQVQARRGYFGS